MIFLIIFKIIFFCVLLLSLSFFSASETAITSLSVSFLRRTKEKEIKYSNIIIFLENHSQEVITAMIIVMNLSVVGMSIVLSSLAMDIAEYCEININTLDFSFPILSIVLALTIGSILPKTIARYNSEKWGIFVLPIIIKVALFFRIPINFLLTVSNKIMKMFLRRKESKHIKADEIDFLLSDENTSPLSDESRELVRNIMDFKNMKVSQVMMPVSEIFAVDIELPKDEMIKKIIDTKYSRVPVYSKNISNIIGIIYAKDLAVAWRNSGIIIIEDLIRSPYFTPENAKVSKVLKEFRTGRHHIAIVVDEFGYTIGLASIEDLLEEIVGNVWDEHDFKEKTIIQTKNNSYIIEAYESIMTVNGELNIDIPEGDYATINGWILEIFGKIPQGGEKIHWNGYLIEIQDADLKKVKRIVLKKCTTQ
ncbi:MAG: hemolysin family protein [Endomicrobium sp.]|jgi:CBS domain containing-hemolysin-like protein|nr:hemolysin family protein [Endomicrobium sp.]